MFQVLKNAPDLQFAGVEFFGNEISRLLKDIKVLKGQLHPRYTQ